MDILGKLILTVGLPRSGKSTIAKSLGYPIVNPDSIRLALYGQRFLLEAEEMVWVLAKYMVASLFLAGHKTVIADTTNTTEKRRKFWIDKRWTIEYLEVPTSKEVCIKRAEDLNDPDIIPIIEKMAAQFEPIVNGGN